MASATGLGGTCGKGREDLEVALVVVVRPLEWPREPISMADHEVPDERQPGALKDVAVRAGRVPGRRDREQSRDVALTLEGVVDLDT